MQDDLFDQASVFQHVENFFENRSNLFRATLEAVKVPVLVSIKNVSANLDMFRNKETVRKYRLRRSMCVFSVKFSKERMTSSGYFTIVSRQVIPNLAF